MATLPIAIGMIAEVMPCFFSASCNSTAASTSATATRATKRRLEVHQAEHDVRAESHTDADGGRQVAAGAAVRLRRRGRRFSQH